MPYYRGDYYRGDNYYRGDFLGIGRALKKFQPLKALGGLARKVVGGLPVVGPVASSLIPTFGGGMPRIMPPGPPGAGLYIPEPGIAGIAHRAFPGGSSGYGYYNKKGEFIEGRRPRMNVLNQSALRRAGRRVKGFLRIARRLGALPVNRGKGKLYKQPRRAKR